MRLVPRGPFVPVLIYRSGVRDSDGNLISDDALCASVNGRPWPVWDAEIRHRVWFNTDDYSELIDCPGCAECEPHGRVRRRGVWPYCARFPITAEEFSFMIDDAAWVMEWQHDDPKATPTMRLPRAKATAAARQEVERRLTQVEREQE